MNYILISKPNESEWNELVTTSPQGSLFSQTNFLSALNYTTYTCYLVKAQHGEILAGVVVIEDGDSMHIAPCRYCSYQGILFSRSVSMLTDIKRVTREFRLTEYLIQALYERYGNFSMALSPFFKDLRPLLWHNYHENNLPRFTISNRYTAILDLSNFRLENYLKSIRTVRRQEYKKSTAKITETEDSALFMDLYIKTFSKQEIVFSSQHLELVNGIVTSALANGFGRLSMATTIDGVASMALFVYDSNCAYYLFGANNPELRNSGASTALIIDNICSMAKLGLTRLDFLGVNSPNRGDYKLSFNSVLTPYYEVQLDSALSFNPPITTDASIEVLPPEV
jgi:hypothetical protein